MTRQDIVPRYCIRWTAEDLFIKACAFGNIDMAKQLMSCTNVNIHADYEYAFRVACRYGHLHVAKWLATLGVYVYAFRNSAFKTACLNNHDDVAKWLVGTYPNVVSSGFLCNMAMVDWLTKHYPEIDVQDSVRHAFDKALVDGNTEQAKEIAAKYPVFASKNIQTFFTQACGRGDLETAKMMIHDYPGIDVHANKEDAFMTACEKGRLDIMKWLNEFGNINVHAGSAYPGVDYKYIYIHHICNNQKSRYVGHAFTTACKIQRLDIAQWLVAMFPDIDGYACMCCSHINAYNSQHMDVVEWLTENYYDIPIKCQKMIFLMVCSRGHLDMVQYLLQKYPDVKQYIVRDAVLDDALRIIYNEHNRDGNLCQDRAQVEQFLRETFPHTGLMDSALAFVYQCKNNQEDVARQILDANPDLDIYDDDIVELVIKKNNKKALLVLIEANPKQDVLYRITNSIEYIVSVTYIPNLWHEYARYNNYHIYAPLGANMKDIIVHMTTFNKKSAMSS